MRTTVASVSEELNSLTSRHSRPNNEDTLGKAKASIGKNEENNNFTVLFQSIFPAP